MRHFFITSLQQPVEAWLKAFPDLCVHAEAGTIASDLDEIVVWLHAQLEQADYWKTQLEVLIAELPMAKVVVLSNNPEQAEAMLALGLGAAGYLHAYAHQQVLREVSSVVTHGGIWLGRELLKYLISKTTQHARRNHAQIEEVLDALTRREREVALEAAKGLSNKEIARVLSISERTVKAHLTSVFETLKIKDRLHLALVLQGQPGEGGFFLNNSLRDESSANKLHLHS